MRIPLMSTLAVLLLAGCLPPPAGAVSVTMIDTPFLRHTYSDCPTYETVLQRHLTVATVVTDCAAHATLPNAGWTPSEHPDGAPLLWVSRVRARNDQEPFMQCTLLHVTDSPGYRLLHFECLDDPVASSVTSRSAEKTQ